MTAHSITMGKLVAAAVALVAAGAVAVACSGSGSGAEGGGPEAVARRAVEALIARDEPGYLLLVRPDASPGRYFDDEFNREADYVAGCNTKGAETLAQGRAGVEGSQVTLLFAQPCGSREGSPVKKCYVFLVRLSGRWYLEGGDPFSCFE